MGRSTQTNFNRQIHHYSCIIYYDIARKYEQLDDRAGRKQVDHYIRLSKTFYFEIKLKANTPEVLAVVPAYTGSLVPLSHSRSKLKAENSVDSLVSTVNVCLQCSLPDNFG